MKRPYYVRADGVVIHPGDWVQIDKGIGRFAGIWENRTLGCATELALYRSFAEPDERSAVFITLSDQRGRDVLDRAHLVAGSLKANGTRPARREVAPHFIRPGWSPGAITVAGAGGVTYLRFGWVRGSFGIFEAECDPLPVLSLTRVPMMTHLRTGYRFGAFENMALATEMAEIAEAIAPWADLESSEAARREPWLSASSRMFEAWMAVGLRSASNIEVFGSPLLVRVEPEQPRKPAHPSINRAMASLIDSLKTGPRLAVAGTKIEDYLAAAPADHPAHRIMASLVHCRGCGHRGTLRDVRIDVGDKGDNAASCAHCKSQDVVVLEEAGAVQ